MDLGPPLLVERFGTYLTRWQRHVRHQLSASDSETWRLSDLLLLADAEGRARWDGLTLGYGEPRGAEWLRAEVAATYDAAGPEDVACFSGAQEGLYAAMHALLAPGDHAVVVTPTYQAAETVPAGICAVTGVPLLPVGRGGGWELDLDRLADAVTPATRLVSVNFPNNPTGCILPRADWDALVALCRRHGLWLFSDEVYRGIERDPALRLPQAADAYERGISLGTLAKAYGLPGLRVGWVACRDRDALARMAAVREVLSGSNARPSEVLAGIALRAREGILARNRAIAEGNRALLGHWFGARPDLFGWQEPDGGVTAFPRYRGSEGVDRFAERLILRGGVMVLPGSLYRSSLPGAGGGIPDLSDRFRVGYGRADLPEALDALGQALH